METLGPTREIRAIGAACEMSDHLVQADAIDELHGKKTEPVVFSVRKHRDDVRMVQPGRSAGFQTELLALRRIRSPR